MRPPAYKRREEGGTACALDRCLWLLPPSYSGYVVGIVGLVVAIGLWMLKKWSLWATIVVCVLNFLLGVPGLLFAPGAALKAVIAITEVVAVLIIVLVAPP